MQKVICHIPYIPVLNSARVRETRKEKLKSPYMLKGVNKLCIFILGFYQWVCFS